MKKSKEYNPEGMSCSDIGKVMGITARGVEAIEKRALVKVRRMLEAKGLTASDFYDVLRKKV